MACVFTGAAILSGCVQLEEQFSTEGKTPLDAPVVTAGEVTTSSISFSWSPVSNAGQYYYKVVNPAGYTVAKGLTRETSATVKGIKFSTTFKVYVNSVPAADVAESYCASTQTEVQITTDDPIVIDYEWVQDGTAYFYGDANYNEHKITFGREKGTGHFIITSWIGSDGFDLYFDITDFDGSSYPINFEYGTPVFQPLVGQAIDQIGPIGDRGDLQLSHGLGGKAYDYVYWYGKGASYDYGTIDPTGGFIDLWCLDFDGTWCGYHVEYGAYEPEPEPEPVPDPDASASWESEAIVSYNGEELADGNISFDAASGAYTIPAWFGVEGYDLTFTRNEATGDWIVDPSCSAYAFENEDGQVGLYHGLGRAKNSICWIDATAWASGLSGDEAKGNVFAAITGPDGEAGTYSVSWPRVTYAWTLDGSYYSGRYDSTSETTISYNAGDDTYTLFIPQYSGAKVVFKTDAAGSFIPVDGDIFQSDDTWWWIDYGDGDWVYVNVPASSANLAAGSISLDVWNGSDEWTDTFTWKPLPGIDDLVGTYAQASEGYWWSGSAWEYPSWTGDVTITKVDDTTVQIVGLIDCTDPIIGTVDPNLCTITMAPGQPFQGSYFFQAYETGGEVVASFDADCNITFINTWSVVNSGGSLYWDNIITSLSKK